MKDVRPEERSTPRRDFLVADVRTGTAVIDESRSGRRGRGTGPPAAAVGPVFCGWVCPLGLLLDLTAVPRRLV